MNIFQELGFEEAVEGGALDINEELGFLTGGESPRSLEIPPRPISEASLMEILGDWGRGACQEGVVVLPEPVGGAEQIRVHRRLQPLFQAFVNDLWDHELQHLLKTISGYGTGIRPVAKISGGTRRIKMSAWGASLTINEAYNRPLTPTHDAPYGQPETYVKDGRPGFSFYEGHPVVELARAHRIVWAGGYRFDDKDQEAECTPIRRPEPAVFMYCSIW